MNRPRSAALAVLGLVLFAGAPAAAQDYGSRAAAKTAPPPELSAQERRDRRARTRIQVYPRRPGYLGPNARRDCTSWLEEEWRPSGTVIVPRLRCWWVPG